LAFGGEVGLFGGAKEGGFDDGGEGIDGSLGGEFDVGGFIGFLWKSDFRASLY
jgi:hypothetical protein